MGHEGRIQEALLGAMCGEWEGVPLPSGRGLGPSKSDIQSTAVHLVNLAMIHAANNPK